VEGVSLASERVRETRREIRSSQLSELKRETGNDRRGLEYEGLSTPRIRRTPLNFMQKFEKIQKILENSENSKKFEKF